MAPSRPILKTVRVTRAQKIPLCGELVCLASHAGDCGSIRDAGSLFRNEYQEIKRKVVPNKVTHLNFRVPCFQMHVLSRA